MGAMEVAQGLREAVVDGPRDADPQPSVELAPQGGDRLATALGGGQGSARVRQQRLAGDGEADPATVAMKERLTELALQATDLRTDGRLGNRDAARGTCELPLFGHGHEV
jgi:hypothetical protein